MGTFEITWSEKLHVGVIPGLSVVERATIETHEQGVGTIRVEVVYDEFLERLVAQSVTVSAMPGEEVTGTQLRAVRVQELIQEAAETMVYRYSEVDGWTNEFPLFTDSDFEEARANVDARVRLAARLYAVAKLLNQPPLKAVAADLEVSHSTATRLISRARREGQLNPDG